MAKSERAVDPIFATTTPIRFPNDGGGTGFFINYEGETYLVTNRHVLEPEDENAPSSARIWLRDRGNIGSLNHFDITLATDDGSSTWYGHPTNPEYDVAVVPLDPTLSTLDDVQNQEHTSGSLAFTRNHYIHPNIQVDERVTVLGYPGNFMDRSTYFPVKRNALIASPYGVDFNGHPVFITDARMHPGTSGSPVIMEAGGMMMTSGDVPSERSKGKYLLGIHSATVYQMTDIERQEAGGDVQFDLNIAWYPRVLDDILMNI